MPKGEEGSSARQYQIESEYIAVSDNRRYTAPITKEELNVRVGSQNYAVCLKHFAIYLNPTSRIAHLRMENDNEALTLCKIKNVKLPYPEQA